MKSTTLINTIDTTGTGDWGFVSVAGGFFDSNLAGGEFDITLYMGHSTTNRGFDIDVTGTGITRHSRRLPVPSVVLVAPLLLMAQLVQNSPMILMLRRQVPVMI